jgi:acyl-coenzyme A synthetase/AMP-(fatty) acid ligase
MPEQQTWIATPHIRPDFRGPIDRVYVPFGDPASAPPMIEMLRAVVGQFPDSLAVEEPAGLCSFASLLRAIARLRAAIVACQPVDGPVGLMLPAGAACVVAVFACLAAGRLGVMLDDGHPDGRNAEIVRETGVKLVLAASADRSAAASAGVPFLPVAPMLEDAADAPELAIRDLGMDDPAFILCTSGSSGRPKPVVHSQRTMLHWARTTHDAMHVRPDDRVLSLSSPASLGGFTALLSYPLVGASSQMLDVRRAGLAALLNTLSTRPVTILRAAPSLLRSLVQLPETAAAFARLRIVQTYGESLMKTDLAALATILPPHCRVRSTYGSTEASGLSWFAGEPDDHDAMRVASGTLMPDTEAAVVDDAGRPCPAGEPGELLIRSRYNALGEWCDGRLVAGRLAPDPRDGAVRIFRTGDIARYHSDGVFVVLGRADRMLKINGQRVEPAEIEAVLRRSPAVRQAEVLLRRQEGGGRLLAFVVPQGAPAPGFELQLRAELRAALPDFMLPARIFLVASVPVLASGKVDALALLAFADRAAAEA